MKVPEKSGKPGKAKKTEKAEGGEKAVIIAASAVSAFIAAGLLAVTKIMGPDGILVLDRFFPVWGGWLQIFLIGSYSGIIAYLLQSRKDTTQVRLGIWNLFSIVFFLQFIAGIFISKTFLMSGTLHIPVPALILADPVYRGGSFFMPVLFLSTVVLVGPAWCSHLCYFGSWDGRAASAKRSAGRITAKLKRMRYSVFFFVIAAALIMRLFHAPLKYAAIAATAFGVLGTVIMATVSRKRGLMVHCTSYCPIGLLSSIMGKISPFRIKVDTDDCLYCMKCATVCRYDALGKEDLEKGRAGFTCTLCGDCLSSCSRNSLHYSFPGLTNTQARRLFIILVSSLNAVFLGIARI